jgi:hypothetical protein
MVIGLLSRTMEMASGDVTNHWHLGCLRHEPYPVTIQTFILAMSSISLAYNLMMQHWITLGELQYGRSARAALSPKITRFTERNCKFCPDV